MKKIALLAPTGMLGSGVYRELGDKYQLILLYRSEANLKKLNKVYGGVDKHKKIKIDLNKIYEEYGKSFYDKSESPSLERIIKQIGEPEAFINCSGIIKPFSLKNPGLTFFVNGALPHLLSKYYKDKLIQITTDCVFSGVTGAPYYEDSKISPNDIYGLSKSLGEPQDCLVLRTSVIGPELHSSVSFLDWVRSQKGKVYGFTNHFWNGITVKEFGRICEKIISERKAFPKNGKFHIFSTDVTKFEMVEAVNKKYNLGLKVVPKKTGKTDRRLRSLYGFSEKLKIPSFEQMIDEL